MRPERGFTYIELIIATMLLAILASAIIPVAQVTAKRAKEIGVREDLPVQVRQVQYSCIIYMNLSES